nr:regulator of ribosome biosynthesis [Quercus suber]
MAASDPRPQPYTFDLGHLMCIDAQPLAAHTPSTLEATLAATAQGCAQALIHQLLTTCTIARSGDGDLQLQLPAPETRLPREKPVPKEKEATRWEKFAAKKGIKAKRRDGKLVFEEASGEWRPKYGYKGKGAEGADWLVEVDDKAERKRAEGGGEKEGAGKKRKGFSEETAARKGKMGRKGRCVTHIVEAVTAAHTMASALVARDYETASWSRTRFMRRAWMDARRCILKTEPIHRDELERTRHEGTWFHSVVEGDVHD